MRDILATAVAAVLFLTGAAQARPVGNPFLRGVKSPAELASKVEASLAKDPSGRAIIDDERCLHGGSCASPDNYLQMFQESDPDAGLVEAAQLPAYLRTLRVVTAPVGEYWMACLKPTSNGTYTPVLHCVSRRFKFGEMAWIDSRTGRIVLASDCTNPVEKEVPKKCVEVPFFTKIGDTEVRFALLGPSDIDDDCIAVKRAGATEFDVDWEDECVRRGDCSFSAAEAITGQRTRRVGSYVPEPGEHILRLPPEVAEKGSLYHTVLCLSRGDHHSDGVGAVWSDYRLQKWSNVLRATIWYDQSLVPPTAPPLYWRWQGN